MVSKVNEQLKLFLDACDQQMFEARIAVSDIDRFISGVNFGTGTLQVILDSLPNSVKDISRLASYLRMSLLVTAFENNEFQPTVIMNKVVPFTKSFVDQLQPNSDAAYIELMFNMAVILERLGYAFPWKPKAVEWSLKTIGKNGLGEVGRRGATKFLKTLIYGGSVPASQILPELIETVARSGDQFHDWASGLVLMLQDQISHNMALQIIGMAPNRDMISMDFCKLVAAMMVRENLFSALCNRKQWRNAMVRLTIMKLLVEQGMTQLIPMMVDDPEALLDHFVVVYSHLSEEAKKANIEKWIMRLDNQRVCPSTHVTLFISTCAPFSLQQSELMYIVMMDRFKRNPVLLKYLMEACPVWASKRAPCIAALAFNTLMAQPLDPACVDWAFKLFDYLQDCASDDYVYVIPLVRSLLYNNEKFIRAEAIRFLDRYGVDDALEEIAKIALSDSEQYTRLAAMDVLSANIEKSVQFKDIILAQLLFDQDLCVREKAILYAGKLIQIRGTVSNEVQKLLENRKCPLQLLRFTVSKTQISALLGATLSLSSESRLAAMDVLSANIEKSVQFKDIILAQLLFDQDLCVREKAILYAGKLIQIRGTVSNEVQKLLENRKVSDDDEACLKATDIALGRRLERYDTGHIDEVDDFLSQLLQRLSSSNIGSDNIPDCF
ncbi:hypothetical protein Tcan_11185 [Toxocara canis]|uniref:Uncharacterized protein n=1 Tax=Toxocara canis TaxID=6265 RepID=A0A0B2W065_TOXCA|nr:hypothetical protein Tcan_11185 [Toxocara canis]